MGHAVGAPHRFNRDLSGSFGSKKYAFEELVALSGQSGRGLSGQLEAAQGFRCLRSRPYCRGGRDEGPARGAFIPITAEHPKCFQFSSANVREARARRSSHDHPVEASRIVNDGASGSRKTEPAVGGGEDRARRSTLKSALRLLFHRHATQRCMLLRSNGYDLLVWVRFLLALIPRPAITVMRNP
jgi:Zincin-like metallopeptidase